LTAACTSYTGNRDERPYVLVACPTYDGKRYALQAWADAYDAFTYPNRSAFMVDNSVEHLDYVHTIRASGIPAAWVPRLPNFWDTIELCFWKILRRAEWLGATHVVSVEADVICPPETLSVLLSRIDASGLVSHMVPWRDGSPDGCWSLGCALFEVERLRRGLEGATDSMECVLFTPPGVSLHGILDIRHLNDPDEPGWTGGGAGK